MKIVHAICGLRTGGTEQMLIDILREQALSDNQISLIVINDCVDEELKRLLPAGVNVKFIGRPEGSRNPLWIVKYNIALRKLRPDIVHFHNDGAAAMTFRTKGPLYVGTVHAPGLAIGHQLKLDRLFAISRCVQDDIRQRYGLDSQVIYNGIRPEALSSRSHLQMPDNRGLKIVQIGRLVHGVKGQDILLNAAGLLVEKGLDLTVDFIGEGESEKYLRHLADKLNLSEKIRFLGNCSRDYIYTHLQSYDLLVQPSRIEGFGLTIAEAMAAKVPVLACDEQGPMEILCDAKYGELFKSGSAEDLADKIQLMSADYSRYSSCAVNEAYSYCVNNFDITKTAQLYLDAYARLLSPA